LFVEGKLDIEVLSPVLQGSPALQQGGSKNALKPRAAAERRGNGVAAGYLRDRDFDFDPPPDLTKPAVDSEDAGVPFGWRWCRHEIENYLIDPAVVCEATAWAMPEVLEAIHRAAKRIRSYQAARWTVGVVRRALPPAYELQTRPGGLREIDLPPSLDAGSVNAWASNSVENHGVRIAAATAPPAVQASLAAYSARFDDAFVADAASVVLWFSGKDLLAGMADWPAGKGVPNPGALRAILRDWIIANPDRALELLPEWKNMLAVVRA
jgi:hypothetical protein